MSASSNALQSAQMKRDRFTYIYNWEKLFTTFVSYDLNIFDKTGKGTAYSGLLVRYRKIWCPQFTLKYFKIRFCTHVFKSVNT